MSGKNILMVWGGWDGHTPEKSTLRFAERLRADGHTVRVEASLDAYLDEAAMSAADLIVQCVTMSQISKEQAEGLFKAVSAGAGFAGWHGGIIDSFRQHTGYQWMTGGQWVSHPGGCIPAYSVDIVDRNHPITRGLDNFVLPNTEQYYIHVDPGVHVLATTTFSGEYGEKGCYPAGVVMPYAWTRTWEKGRVFVACWGHTVADFDVPAAFEFACRGLLWAAR